MKRLAWIEAMRGIAAMWVVMHHAGQASVGFLGAKPMTVFVNGYLGVDFFFVLSGFIIAVSSQHLAETGRGLREYATARAVRIYVPYLPVGVLMLVAYSALPGLSQGVARETGALTSLTLLPSNYPPALSVAWTLVHEILFYATFSLFFVSRRALVAVLWLWTAGMLWVLASGVQMTPLARYFFSPLNLCFVLGVLLAWLTRRGIGNGLALMLAVGGLLMVASQAMSMSPSRIAVALGFAALVAAARSPAALAASPGHALLKLGAASYAVYLVHNPVQSLVARVIGGAGPLAGLVLLIIAGAAAGLAYHALYEKRALRWVRQRLASAPVTPPAPA